MPTAAAAPPAHVFAQRLACQPVFGVKRPLWRKDDEHAALSEPGFAATRDSVLRRDNHACRYCGFKSAKYQEIHHHDGDHGNHELNNLMTACNLCHQVHHLGMAGMRQGGFIAAIPELTQTEVNHLARACLVADAAGEAGTRDRLTGLYALLQARSDSLKAAFGLDLASPLLLAEVLALCDEATYGARATVFATLRLVPTRAAFQPGQLDYMAANQRKLFNPASWAALARPLIGPDSLTS